MADRQCEKCGEFADEAKAFCPGCGNAMLEEQERTDSSRFDQAEMTMHLGQTMYNQMLSDMGLNTSKAPDAEKSTVIEPVPAAKPVDRESQRAAAPAKGSNKKLWIIAIAAVIALFFLALLVLGVAGYLIYRGGAPFG